jgi:hypothetical protein
VTDPSTTAKPNDSSPKRLFIDPSGAEVHRTYAETVAAAQVHATLALAAATALAATTDLRDDGHDGRAWYKAAATKTNPDLSGNT